MLTSNGWALKKCSRDCKIVGYGREGTSLKGNRVINIILLVTLADSWAIFEGTELRKKQVGKYVFRRPEPKKRYRRRSTFGVGLDGEKWVNYLEQYSDEVEQLIKLTRNKRRFYQQSMRAATLIRSISIASLSPPQGVNLPLEDFRCSKNESTGHEMRLSRSFLQANLDC
jgi:hypothetical protein